ncbi:MAG: DUF4416 family protein [Deltaproteobacteria bacterium]
MSKLKEPRPVKLFMSLIHTEDAPAEGCIAELEAELSESDFRLDNLPFDSTPYYGDEMGRHLSRILITHKYLIPRERLVDAKIFAVHLEQKYSVGGRRSINIDPGYIAPEHLILSTGKGYYHRPYLGRGVYADLTLVYRRSSREFHTLEWTYPDYGAMRALFKDLRGRYMKQLARERA